MMTIETISPEWVEFEGFHYLVWEGECFKGCRRCGGAGHFSYNGEHSRCYECDDTSAKLGEPLDSREAAEKWCHGKALARAARERKREREAQALRDKLAAKRATVPADVLAFLDAVNLNAYAEDADYERSPFIQAMAEQVQWPSQAERPFTENMLAGVQKTMAARAEKKTATVEVPEGRITIRGTVVSTKVTEDNGFGPGYKMLVQDERGFRVYGSIPNSLWNEVEFLGAYRKSAWGETDGVMTKLVGMELTFVATVERSSNDAGFGFFKRPAKAEVVA